MYLGDYINPETKLPEADRLVDIAGSKIVYTKVKDLYAALEKFSGEYKILKIKDRIQKPLNGYRDILMNIEMKNGHIVEFRLHLKEMDDVAGGAGHKLYEQQRSLEAISQIRSLIREEKIKIVQLKNKQLELYENTWNKIISK
jgi:(p)ppGpp synthase/HD superfamily hydrolase